MIFFFNKMLRYLLLTLSANLVQYTTGVGFPMIRQLRVIILFFRAILLLGTTENLGLSGNKN